LPQRRLTNNAKFEPQKFFSSKARFALFIMDIQVKDFSVKFHIFLKNALVLFCANFFEAKCVLRTRTVFAKPTDGSTRFASEVGIESAKKHKSFLRKI
jgi:hypothetical protein